MGISFKAERLCEELRKRANAVDGRKAIRVGVTDRKAQEYAVFVEFGWVQKVTKKQRRFFAATGGVPPPSVGSTLVNPPRPFLRGTLAAEEKKWAAMLKNKLTETGSPEAALDAVGAQAVNDIWNTIVSGGTSKEKFAKRSPLTMAMLKEDAKRHKASGKNTSAKSASTTDQPLVLTSLLRDSIGYKHV